MSITFKQFISESAFENKIDLFLDTIGRECSEFLSENKRNLQSGNFLYRGINNKDSDSSFVIHHRRESRKPLDMNNHIHKLLNDYFFEKFNFRYRDQGVFCTADRRRSSAYGDRFIVFPSNGYQILSSPKVRDLFDVFNNPSAFAEWYFNENPDDDDEKKDELISLIKRIEKGYEIFDYTEIEDLLDACEYKESKVYDSTSNSELIIKCNTYYGMKENSNDFTAGKLNAFIRELV